MTDDARTALIVPMTYHEAFAAVAAINAHLADARAILFDLYEREGWRALGYPSWRDCVAAEFQHRQAHLYRLLDAARIDRVLAAASEPSSDSPIGEIPPVPESHARELAPLLRHDEQAVVDVYRDLRDQHGDKVTAKVIRRAVERKLGVQPAAASSLPSASPSLHAPPSTLHGRFHRGDCRDWLPTLPEASVQLVVTSPPYNVGWNYGDGGASDRLTLADYQAMLAQVLRELHRVLRPGGVLAINVPASIHQPIEHGRRVRESSRAWPLAAWLQLHLADTGWLQRDNPLVWLKTANEEQPHSFSLAIGSATNPYLRPCHELVILASKETYRLPQPGQRDDIPGGYLDALKDVWSLPPGRAQAGRPVAFPDGLVQRLILLFSAPGDVVLDPFAGVGTVGRIALVNHRVPWLAERQPAYWPLIEAALETACVPD